MTADYDQILKVQSDDVETRLSSAGLKSTLCTASSCPFNSTTKFLETVSNTCGSDQGRLAPWGRKKRLKVTKQCSDLSKQADLHTGSNNNACKPHSRGYSLEATPANHASHLYRAVIACRC